jgi:hypothetical protein
LIENKINSSKNEYAFEKTDNRVGSDACSFL